ncbi:hypothetical protein TEA_015662 [Camellia sinensis var. sinensis]|uniref:Programmed cell death protein 2 C-terminal domain-containing protein n=1 Tax=Camellia sinensis var. sinensis TaxID=542762 RepID=A0A4S4EEC6_CAMSN|nr:hypothetical protein TEA_015662 [Camellia sinensis var. sinensis]
MKPSIHLLANFEGDGDRKSWASFQERIARAPEQVLRYCTYYERAKPLWPISSGRPSKTDITKCSYCGGPQGFEFQPLAREPGLIKRNLAGFSLLPNLLQSKALFLDNFGNFFFSGDDNNVIVITLLAKSGQLLGETPAINNAETDLYDELIKNIGNEINYGPESCPPVPESKEIVY